MFGRKKRFDKIIEKIESMCTEIKPRVKANKTKKYRKGL